MISGPLGAKGQRRALHRAAEGLERLGSALHQRRDVRVDARVPEVGTEGDLEARDPVVEPGRVVGGPGLQTGVIPRVRARHRLQHQRGVAHGAGHRPDMGDLVVVRHRPVRHPPVGWLEAEDAAEVGRHADRPRAVRALVQRPVARRGGRSGAGGGGACIVAFLPRVRGDAGKRAVAHARPAELRGGGLAEDDGAGLFQPRNHRRVHRRHMALQRMGAPLGGDPGGLGQILDRDWQAEQRTRGVASRQRGLCSLRGVASALGGECGEGVDAGLAGLDAGQHGVDQLDRREFLTPDQRRKLGGGRKAEIIGHRRLLGGRGLGRGSWRALALVSSRRGGHRGVRQAAGLADPGLAQDVLIEGGAEAGTVGEHQPSLVVGLDRLLKVEVAPGRHPVRRIEGELQMALLQAWRRGDA